ncbi:MAG: SPOR domain-containing protein [Betaproteobacteria bacterium]|nr:SPOR domain-containing protein [Betaproteobacteria bacterium]
MRRRKVAFSSDLRQTALKRAGLAVAAALALLLAVLWFGDSDQPSNSLNVVPEQHSVSALKTNTAVLPEPSPTAINKPVGVSAPAATEAEHTPSAIPAQAAEAAPSTAPPLGSSKKADASTDDSPKVAKVPAKPISLLDGYFVQLGVFNDTENVDRVFENVTALGMPAHIQSHIVVGPFRNKREAEAARNRLKDIAEGTVLPPPRKAAKPSGKPKAKPKSRRRAK